MAQQQIIDHEAFVIHPSVAIDRARVFTVMSPTRVQLIIDDLPSGWTAYGVKRKHGQTAGRSDLYLYGPDGQKFRSSKEVQRFIESQNQVPAEEDKEREYSPLENDWCQKVKDTPVTPAFPKRQKGYSSSHPSKTMSSKKVKFPEKPSVSLPSENPNKRKRGRPRKARLNSEAEVCSVAESNATCNVLSGTPRVASKRKQLRPTKLLGTAEIFSSDDSNGAKTSSISSLNENKENLVSEGQTSSSDLARLCSSGERHATVSKNADPLQSGSDGLLKEKVVLRSPDREESKQSTPQAGATAVS